MSKLYNILWIDDEWEKMPSFMKECEEYYHLKLWPYKTRKAGMEALEQNLDMWHAVLLDAKMFDETENEVAKLTGMSKAKAQLERLSCKKAIPYFISTGQPDLLDDENFEEMVGKYYEKDTDDEQLIKDIVAAIQKSETLQVKAIYEHVFHTLESLGISEYTDDILLDIFVPLHFPEKASSFKPVHHYNQLRQLVEYIFRACNRVGIIPNECIPNSIVNLSQCSLYIAGKDAEKVGVRYGEPGDRIIPTYIESIIRSVLEFGNVHSHTVELDSEDLIKVESILRSAHSKYLIYGLALQMCEVITWFSNYITANKNREENLAKCKTLPKAQELDDKKSKYEGQIFVPEKDNDGDWHCGECTVIISHWESGKMRLKEVADNTNRRTKSKYPYFAKYDKIDE